MLIQKTSVNEEPIKPSEERNNLLVMHTCYWTQPAYS